MRHSPTGPVYRIGPTGDVTRFTLKPPEDSYLSEVKVANGRLAAEFIRNKPGSYGIDAVIVQVVILETGEIAEQYLHSDGHIGSALACYKPDEFVFLVNDENGVLMLAKVHAPA